MRAPRLALFATVSCLFAQLSSASESAAFVQDIEPEAREAVAVVDAFSDAMPTT